MSVDDMLSVEQARQLVLSNVGLMDKETVSTLNAVNRICAADIKSDIDVAPFAHSAMDGFALMASSLQSASTEKPVALKVVAEVAAGDVYSGVLSDDECVRIMTGAEVPECADAVVKYEIVDYGSGDGKCGSVVYFSAPTKVASNIRAAGEEARAGEVVVSAGERINPAGVGFLASCGALEVTTYKRPRVAIIATGSELVDPSTVPSPGHIRESNSYAIAACVQQVDAVANICSICKDDFDSLQSAVSEAVKHNDFVITTGGAANGDFDFIKQVVHKSGTLLMTLVNMRPGKAQTFGIVDDTPVFGLPGNPAAAYCGFQMLIRPALRKMQGFTNFDLPVLQAKLATDCKMKDPRRIYLRSSLKREEDGSYTVYPAPNQSSGLFSTLQRGNTLAIMPEGQGGRSAGDIVDCIMLDISEDTAL